MYATLFYLDLGKSESFRDRGQSGRSLATALAALQGFVAFIAVEAEDGTVAGLCVCADAAALEAARRTADTWQQTQCGSRGSTIQPLMAGEVIVQRGF